MAIREPWPLIYPESFTWTPQPQGCICPPTSEQTCQNDECPRQSQKARAAPVQAGNGPSLTKPVTIIAAALRLPTGGVCYGRPPERHGDLLTLLCETHTPQQVARAVQGFLTSEYRFVDRVEAKQVALAAGQITKTDSEQLFSEDLW